MSVMCYFRNFLFDRGWWSYRKWSLQKHFTVFNVRKIGATRLGDQAKISVYIKKIVHKPHVLEIRSSQHISKIFLFWFPSGLKTALGGIWSVRHCSVVSKMKISYSTPYCGLEICSFVCSLAVRFSYVSAVQIELIFPASKSRSKFLERTTMSVININLHSIHLGQRVRFLITQNRAMR